MDLRQLEKSTVRKVTMRLIPFLFICFAISILDRVNIGFAALRMNEDLGFSEAVYGFGAGIFFLGYFLLEVPGSAMMSKIGARRWISRIMVTWGLMAVVMAFIQTPIQFYIVRFLLGVAEASFYPCMVHYLSGFYQSKHHAKAIAGFMIAIPAANAIGSPLSTFLLQIEWFGLSGWQWLFILEAIPAVILGIICYFYLTDRIEDAKWLTGDEKTWLLDVTRKEALEKQKSKKPTFLEVLRDKDVLILAIGYFFWMFGYYGINMFLPTISRGLTATTGWSLQSIGWLLGFMYLCAMVVMYLVGKSSDKRNERKLHVAGCLTISAIAMIASVYVSEFSMFGSFALLTVSLCGAFGAYSPFWAIPPSFLTGAAAGGAIALINSIGNLGGFFGPYFVGFINDLTGSHNFGLTVLGISMIISATIIIFLVKQTGKSHKTNPGTSLDRISSSKVG